MSFIEHESVSQAKDAALTYLGHQDRTVRQVQRKLRQKGFDDVVITAVIAQLQRVCLVDDRAYARRLIESRMKSRPAGEARLAQDLQQRGVGCDVIQEVLDEFDEEIGSEDAALQVLRQNRWRYLGLSSEKAKRRMFGLLGRRGFDIEISRSAVEQMLSEVFEDGDQPATTEPEFQESES